MVVVMEAVDVTEPLLGAVALVAASVRVLT
jgi:hypothetical protein